MNISVEHFCASIVCVCVFFFLITTLIFYPLEYFYGREIRHPINARNDLLHGAPYTCKRFFFLELSTALIKNIFSNIMNILVLEKTEEAVYKWKSESRGGRLLARPLFDTNNRASGRGTTRSLQPLLNPRQRPPGSVAGCGLGSDSLGVQGGTAPQRKPHLI